MKFTPRKVRTVPKRDVDHTVPLIDHIIQSWCRITLRPEDKKFPAAARDTILQSLDTEPYASQKKNYYYFDNLVRIASLLPQDSYDEDDTDRIVKVFTMPEYQSIAMGLSKNFHVKTITFHEALASISTLDDIAALGGYDSYSDVPQQDRQYVLRLIHTPKHRVKEMFATTSRVLSFQEVYSGLLSRGGKRGLYPSVSKENQATSATILAKKFKKPKKVDFYAEGEAMQKKFTSEFLDVDEEASDLMMRGVTMDAVLKFHNEAPRGYWEAVNNRMLKNEKLDIEQIYDSLSEVFDFHPDDREPPMI